MSRSNPQNHPARKKLIAFLSEIYNIWITERPAQFAAALAYYAIFSFVPVIYVAFELADLIFSKLSVADWFYIEVTNLLGEQVALYMQDGVTSLANTTTGGTFLASTIGFIAILLSASLIFFQLQQTLNTIWQVPPRTRGATGAMLRNRLLAFVMLLGVILFLVLVVIANLIISFIASHVQLNFLISTLSFFLLAGLGTLSFALIFKILPNAKVAWKYIWLGAGVAALLIAAIVQLLGSYLSTSRFSSSMEAAGAMAVLLIAFYFLGQIFVFGALLTRVSATMFGEGITPKPE